MQSALPKISVIVPSFNQGQYIEATLQSILSQNYPALELLVIDGGSTDNTKTVIEKYSSKISYFISEKDNGQSEAINKGLKRATGDIITWLCSDDLYQPNCLFSFAKQYLLQPAAGLFHGKSIFFGPGRKETEIGIHPTDLDLQYFAAIPFPQPSSFFTKKVIDKIGLLDESLHYAMDYDYFLRIALEFQVVSVPETWSKYRLHDESKSRTKLPDFCQEWIYVFSKFIHSLNVHDPLLNRMINSGFIIPTKSNFIHTRSFNHSELQTICSYFLYNQFKVWYELLDKKKCELILLLIKEIKPSFYMDFELHRLKNKLNFIPTPIFKLLRSIVR